MLVTDALLTLSDHELFFLLLGFHYHDLGMAGTEADNATASGQGAGSPGACCQHSSKDRRVLERRLDSRTRTKRQFLGEICRGHRPARNMTGERPGTT